MYKVNCGITAKDGIQIEFDSLDDFNRYEERRNKNIKSEISGYIKSINKNILFLDEYNNGIFEWYIVNCEMFLNYFEPMRWHMEQLMEMENNYK